MRRMSLLGLLLGLFFAPPAHAADDDDPLGLDEDDADDEIPEPTLPSDDDDDLPPAPPLDPDRDIDFEEDEFEEDVEFGARKEGQDDARIYREAVDKTKNMDPDQEILEWERYLKKYPDSLFRGRIQERIEELSASMFDTRLGQSSEGGLLDAGRAELRFAQPVQLESIDPRTKLRIGFELGFPEYLGFNADYEHQILRNLSVHGGFADRYTGENFEVGARYALIKSARTNTLLTGIFDTRFNLKAETGFHVGLRPVIGFGQRFDVMDGLDVQAQLGVDLPLGYGSRFAPRYVSGLNVSLALSESLRVFGETSSTIQDPFTSEVASSFRFNVLTFGAKYIARKGKTTDFAEIGAAATLPYDASYWGYHYGTIGADGHLYFK